MVNAIIEGDGLYLMLSYDYERRLGRFFLSDMFLLVRYAGLLVNSGQCHQLSSFGSSLVPIFSVTSL